jgi:hypothetical protein
MKRAGYLVLILGLVGCAETDPLTTTEVPCGYGERVYEYVLPAVRRDVIIVVDSALRRTIEPQLRQLIAGLATGVVDDDPTHRLSHGSELRLAMLTPSQTTAAIGAQASEHIPFLRYRYAPHGYSDDLDAFLERTRCLTSPFVPGCSDIAEYGDTPFEFAELFVVSSHDICRAGEVSTGSAVSCDEELTRMVFAWQRSDRANSWLPSLIVGVPDGIVNLEARSEPGGLIQHVLSDPRMHAVREANICGPHAITAQATPALIEALAIEDGGFASVCATDYRGVLATRSCTSFSSHFDLFGLDTAKLLQRADGTYACTLYETLPATGPITTCSQLEAFGRRPFGWAQAGEREVCEVDQVLPIDQATDYGWFMPQTLSSELAWDDVDPAPDCIDYRVARPGLPAFPAPPLSTPNAERASHCSPAPPTAPLPMCM